MITDKPVSNKKDVKRAFELVTAMLDGFSVDDAMTIATNVVGRVLMCCAEDKDHVFELVLSAMADVCHVIEANWHNEEAERAANGGKHPTVGEISKTRLQ